MRRFALSLIAVLAVAATMTTSALAEPPSPPSQPSQPSPQCRYDAHGLWYHTRCLEASAIGGAGEGRVRLSVSGSLLLRARNAVIAAIDMPSDTIRVYGSIVEYYYGAVVAPGIPIPITQPPGGRVIVAPSLRVEGYCPTRCYIELVADHYAFRATGSGYIEVYELRDSGAGISSSRGDSVVLGDRTGIAMAPQLTTVFYGDDIDKIIWFPFNRDRYGRVLVSSARRPHLDYGTIEKMEDIVRRWDRLWTFAVQPPTPPPGWLPR